MTTDTEAEALARILYAVYSESISKSLWTFEDLRPHEQTAWIILAQWVIATKENEETPDHK